MRSTHEYLYESLETYVDLNVVAVFIFCFIYLHLIADASCEYENPNGAMKNLHFLLI